MVNPVDGTDCRIVQSSVLRSPTNPDEVTIVARIAQANTLLSSYPSPSWLALWVVGMFGNPLPVPGGGCTVIPDILGGLGPTHSQWTPIAFGPLSLSVSHSLAWNQVGAPWGLQLLVTDAGSTFYTSKAYAIE